MGPYEAAHAARLLGVEHVVPMHFSPDVMPIFTGTPEKFQEQIAEIAPNVTVHVNGTGRRPAFSIEGRFANRPKKVQRLQHRRDRDQHNGAAHLPGSAHDVASDTVEGARGESKEIKATSGAASTASGARLPIGSRKGSGASKRQRNSGCVARTRRAPNEGSRRGSVHPPVCRRRASTIAERAATSPQSRASAARAGESKTQRGERRHGGSVDEEERADPADADAGILENLASSLGDARAPSARRRRRGRRRRGAIQRRRALRRARGWPATPGGTE